MLNKIRNIIWKTEGMDFNDNPSNVSGIFNLKYGNVLIGTLEYKNSRWLFYYSEQFKQQFSIKPITDFPDVNKKYEDTSLWPFFASRIPSINQPYQLKKIKKANADKDDSVALLKIFGSTTINNPFSLATVE